MTSGPWIGSRQKKIGYCRSAYVRQDVDIVTDPIQSDNVIIALCSVEFDGETTRVSGRVWEFSP